MKMPRVKVTAKSFAQFEYFSKCQDDKLLETIPLDPLGYSAAECFHSSETYGKQMPCREPELLTRAINGKKWHGVSVTHCAEDYIDRILFARELKENYPEWVRQDILGRARKLALDRVGYVPTFVKTGEDFTTLALP